MCESKVLIVTPAYNEEDNLKIVINDIKQYAENIDWLIVDDCSTDKTVKIIRENNLKYISNENNSGYYKTLQTGIKWAYENGYDYVITFDADGQHMAKEIYNILKNIIDNNSDLVIASRYFNKKIKLNMFQKIGIILSQKVIRDTFNLEITDATSGFRCMNRKIMKEILNFNEIKTLELSFLIYLLKCNYKITEIPTEMNERINGKSMFKGIWRRIKYTKLIIVETRKELKG